MNLNKTHKAIRRFGGHVEDVRTAYSFTGALDTMRVDVLSSAVFLFREGNITQYRAFGSGILGGLSGDPVNSFQNQTGRHSQGKVIPVYVGKNYSHGIRDIIDAFHRNGKSR